MSTRIVELVNAMQPRSYLELGTGDGANFRDVDCPAKINVDTNGVARFTGTTDEFFAQNKCRFDVTFIDANHDLSFVTRDWNNAIAVTDRAIILHDMIPPTKKHCEHGLCSDGYALLKQFLDRRIMFRSLDHDCGLTVVRKKFFREVWLDCPMRYEAFIQEITDSDLICSWEELLLYAKRS